MQENLRLLPRTVPEECVPKIGKPRSENDE